MAIAVLERMCARRAPALPHPDPEKLSRTLSLRRRLRAGDSNLERDISAAIDSGVSKTRLEAERLMAHLESQARMAAAQPLDADHFVSTAEFDIATVEARLFEPLVHARLEERRRLRELRRFKLDHNLERDASYAESILSPAANLALLVAAEAAANALLLQTASTGGYVGGFLIAVIMSLVTVAMGALFAGLLGVRLMRRREMQFRILGGATFAAAFAFAGLWAYALAKYRDAAMLAAAGATPSGRGKKRAAAEQASNGLFGPADGPVLGFSSLESLALVVLGLLVFVLAAMKGAGGRGGFTDSYWGYKPRHAAHRAADEAYQDEQEDYFEALEEAVEGAREQLDEAAGKAEALAAKARGFCDEALSVIPSTHAALNAWRDVRTDLLRRAGSHSASSDGDFSFSSQSTPALLTLRDEMDQRRAMDSATANAARRALKEKLEDAQSRLAARIADAEREADRRLGEELAFLKADEGKLV